MKDKRETLDKKVDNLKLKKIAKKQKLQEQGITLIALVVTIIILLILAGVTLNIALSDNGLFSKAKKVAEDYKEAQSEEEDLINQFATQMYSEYVGAEVTGYDLSSNNSTVTINGTTSGVGGSESQEFTTDENIEWRVWDFDGNTLRIIGDPTSHGLTLKGAAGYNNGVWAIDHICQELYTNGKDGVTATNLKRTDIQKISTYDYTKYKHEPNSFEEELTNGDSSSIYFGETKTYNDNKYPKMWDENDKDWTYKYEDGTKIGRDKECTTWEKIENNKGQMNNDMNVGDATITFKQSYYYHKYEKNEFIKDVYYDLLFLNTEGNVLGKYWLGGRYVHLYESTCEFGIQLIDTDAGRRSLHGYSTCSSNRESFYSGVCASSSGFY